MGNVHHPVVMYLFPYDENWWYTEDREVFWVFNCLKRDLILCLIESVSLSVTLIDQVLLIQKFHASVLMNLTNPFRDWQIIHCSLGIWLTYIVRYIVRIRYLKKNSWLCVQNLEKPNNMCHLECDPSMTGPEKTFSKSIDTQWGRRYWGFPDIISWCMPGKRYDIYLVTTANIGAQEMYF